MTNRLLEGVVARRWELGWREGVMTAPRATRLDMVRGMIVGSGRAREDLLRRRLTTRVRMDSAGMGVVCHDGEDVCWLSRMLQ